MRFNSYIVLSEGLTDREGHCFADAGIYRYWGRMGLTPSHKGQEKYHTRCQPEIATLEPVQDFVSLDQNLTTVQIFRTRRFAELPRQISCLGKTTNDLTFEHFSMNLLFL